jgi:sigma-B regulation protein RsbU (phosphoserine phosphatase)
MGAVLHRVRKNGNGGAKRRKVLAPVAVAAGRGAALPAPYFVPPNPALKEEIAALRREQKEFRDALFSAAQVHRKLCAPRELRRGAFEMAGEMFAVRHLSGAFLKIFDLGATTGLAVGDIVGKGLSAGLWVTHMVGLLHIFATQQGDLSAATASINNELCALGTEPPMTALFLARLDPQSGELVYCNAGQPAGLLLRRDGSLESLQEGGPMLGALPGAAFQCGRATLEPGDTLVAYTDGVVECRNARDEEFGARRLANVASGAATASASQTLFSTLGTVLDFAGGRPLDDDLTLLVVHRRAPSPAGT